MPKTHYARRNETDAKGRPTGEVWALCGRMTFTATRDREEVTCKSCLRELDLLGQAPEEAHNAPSEPWVPPPPRPVKRGAHVLSEVDEQALRDSIRGYRIRATFSSVGSALTRLMEVHVDGHRAPSVSGTYESLAAMGTLIQTSGRGDAASTRDAESVAEVERAISYALRDWTNEPLSRREARAVLLAMDVGIPFDHNTRRRSGIREWSRSERGWIPMKAEELAEQIGHLNAVQVGKLRGRVRRLVAVEMAARGLTPLPERPRRTNDPDRDDRATERYVRLWRAVEARRRELVARRAA